MNTKQKELLDKEFKVNDSFSITRGDYECLPCPLMAWNWSDEQMQHLAKEIARELDSYDFPPETQEDAELAFDTEMENVAVRLGMKYYEDLTDLEADDYEYQWNNIK